ncbi:MAG: efflux RND transporter periplasmic adaptor subunit [Anaerolineales bacterium]|nr:efflux RND transporter periplasmic adaptor subunit [Anaerolineales bacterium]
MKSIYKVLALVLFLAVLAGGGYYYYTKFYLPAQAAPAPVLQTSKVRTGDIVISVTGSGNLIPVEQVSVGFRSSGIVAEVNVSMGDVVEAGHILARLDDSSLRLQLAQAQLNLQGLISPEAIIEAEVAALHAETALETAVEELQLLISPAVWLAENALAVAQQELDRLQAAPGTSAETLQTAQAALDTAQANLAKAQAAYPSVYVPYAFTYTYTDAVTGEELEGIFPPSELDITLARAKAKSAELTLRTAQDYAEQLRLGQPCAAETTLTAAEGTLQSRLEQACLNIAEAELALDKTNLVAPIAGTVTSLNASIGQAVGTTPIITLASLDQLRLRIYVEETDLALLKVNQPVVVNFDAYPDLPVNGHVVSIEPALQTVEGTPVVVAWAVLEDAQGINLLSGMAAEVEVIAGEARGTLLVPVQALRELTSASFAVFLVGADGQLKLTPVTVGLRDYANAEILSGVKAGDIVSTGTVETK